MTELRSGLGLTRASLKPRRRQYRDRSLTDSQVAADVRLNAYTIDAIRRGGEPRTEGPRRWISRFGRTVLAKEPTE